MYRPSKPKATWWTTNCQGHERLLKTQIWWYLIYTELWARLGVIFQILKRLFALHKVYPMQFLICCEIRKQVYTFRFFLFVCLVFIVGEGCFYIYKHTYTHTHTHPTCLKVLIWFLGPSLQGSSFLYNIAFKTIVFPKWHKQVRSGEFTLFKFMVSLTCTIL